MPPHRLVPHVCRRSLSTTSSRPASVLFALGALSNSRETQHFNKLSRLQRIEHSPPLKLIKTSEIDPFPLPTPPPKTTSLPPGKVRSAARIWDAKALATGRAVLANNARHHFHLQRLALRAKRRETAVKDALLKQSSSWSKEREKMRREMRSAGIWILLSIGTATTLAIWKFAPPVQSQGIVDSGEMGRKIAARAQSALQPLGRVSAAVSSPPIGVTGPVTSGIVAGKENAAEVAAVKSVEKVVPMLERSPQSWGTWAKGYFWKQA